MKIGELVQSADWKNEKHVPVIECPDKVKAGEAFDVNVTLGKEIAHPNTTEHHIRWLALYFKPDSEKATYQVARYDLLGHGESPKGPNEGPVYTGHSVAGRVTLKGSGTFVAVAHCNIHGLWESFKPITVD